ncbi:MAG: NUDIX hydrolase [Bacteroidia bacterium]
MNEQLYSAHKFKTWRENLINNGLTVNEITEIYTKFRYNGEVLFSFVSVDALTPEGGKIPPICFIRGASVSVLVCFIDKETKEKYLLLVKQRRVCNGAFSYEQPAGMVDKDDEPLAVAVREVEEETGLQVSESQVIPLNTEAYYSSPGACDEALYFFYCEIELSKEEMMQHDSRTMGVKAEHEHIETCVVPMHEAKRLITNNNGLLNYYLYLEAIATKS